MNGISKKIVISLMIIIAMLFAFAFSTNSFAAKASNTADDIELPAVGQGIESKIDEQKIFCTSTLDEDFKDDTVLVVLNKEASIGLEDKSLLKSYSQNDFLDVAVERVEDLTYLSSEKLSNQIIEKEAQNRSLSEDTKFRTKSDKSLTDKVATSDEFKAFKKINTEKYRKIISIKLKDKGKENVLKAIKRIEKRDDILSAEPDYVQTLSATTPNEYSHLNTNQRWAIDKIELPNAWDTTTGLSSITVGVIDSGIDSTHPDLTNRINRNLSRDFTASNTVVVENPTDQNGHGTHVAGIIGAQGNNYNSNGGTSAIGVCWSVGLASLRVFNADGQGTVSSVTRAVDFATSVEIPVLNYSGGGNSNSNALKQAIMNYQGIFVCAAGNNDRDTDTTPHYPSSHNSLDNLISVGALDSNDKRPDVKDWGYDIQGNPQGSNYGVTSVDIFAPGDDIYSTYPQALSASRFAYLNGTSMATPYVTGVAALISSKYPNLDAGAIKASIFGGSVKQTISTPSGNQTVRRLRADTALAQASKIPNFPELAVVDKGWDINIRNNNSVMHQILYNERMCFEGDAQNFHHLTNIRSFKLSSGGNRTVRITPFGTGTHIAVAIGFTLDNGETIYRVSYANGLSTSGMNDPLHYTVSGGAMGTADLVPNYLEFELTARYGIVPFEWDVKFINTNSVPISVTYNSRMCFDDAARNFMGLRDLADVTVPANGSVIVRIRGNGTAQYITAAINYTVDGARYRRISSGNELSGDLTMSPLRYYEVLVTSSFPTLPSHPANLSFKPIAKSGFIWYTWTVTIYNNSGYNVEVSYNAKLCFEGDAAAFDGLADIVTITIPAWGSKDVVINHNGTAGWITACINYSYGGYEYRRISYANGLAVNSTNAPQYNLIRFT